ncbi:hypothetical protein J7I98_23830 [Streptomyces sp. ISL-98]|uniref:hypothetical protein n=1 Tax=Streptomyces sp. ISL-98 TaxID=2819192 RepID=UPI001BEA2C5D|nr:hypothetical protein [Streptomyces sp. ISL-98]MBT2508861.1 hypothetical protein [Streptomyces sp. ISL-98]
MKLHIPSVIRPRGRHRATPAPAAFVDPQPGTRWLRCDTTTCAHLTRPHTPEPDGAWTCTSCGTTTPAGTQ